ncbi:MULTISPECIES: hypothetical protein [Bacillus]|uniref:hypothetical protein n=1 Tax=Bacillus TaxID=1386 RepID=UPI00057C30A9|nr:MULTISPECIES: hypothetical protein [Bacillus]AUZ29824.1 hypothetical protein C1T27_05560 [Bacillus licheniformis]UAY70744.1 hypothetical protein K8336_01250 [Bacillus paralicheniformis]
MSQNKPTYEQLEERARFVEYKCLSLQEELSKAYDLITNVQALYKMEHETVEKLQQELKRMEDELMKVKQKPKPKAAK